jgi:hypothetical protein
MNVKERIEYLLKRYDTQENKYKQTFLDDYDLAIA